MYNTIEEAEAAYRGYIKEHVDNYNKVSSFVSGAHRSRFFGAVSTEHHDDSKYSAEEFEPYRKHFHPALEDLPDKEGYDTAWRLHQKRNPHHWQYWVLIRGEGNIVPLPMPKAHILEMLCDWTAMGIKFNNVPSKWYAENQNKMLLHPDTRACVQEYMPCFDEAFYGLGGTNE